MGKSRKRYVVTTDSSEICWDDIQKAKDFIIVPLLYGVTDDLIQVSYNYYNSLSIEDLVNHKDTAGSFCIVHSLPPNVVIKNYSIEELYGKGNPFIGICRKLPELKNGYERYVERILKNPVGSFSGKKQRNCSRKEISFER